MNKRKRGSLLETTLNTRDLGGNRTGDGFVTAINKIWRSDKQNYPNERDIRFLKDAGITTVIDMRSPQDTEKSPSGFCELEGFRYLNLPVEAGSGVPESVEAVPYSYMEIACSESMADIFRTIAEAAEGVMINCTAGKDRTGVVSAIILLHCGVCTEDIVADYMATKDNNRPRFELIHKNYPEIDMNIIIPRESYILDFLRMFTEKFGDTDSYFAGIGLTASQSDVIRKKMTAVSYRDTTLCHIEQDGKYLMMHRIKKANDLNEGKWIGVGGHTEPGETADECLLREVYEETGLTLDHYTLRGDIYFISDKWEDEIMHLYTADRFHGELTDCNEGVLAWIPKEEVLNLPLWEGDREFLDLLLTDEPFFRMFLIYRGNSLESVIRA